MDVFRYSKNETFSYKYNTISTILDFKGRIVLATMYMDQLKKNYQLMDRYTTENGPTANAKIYVCFLFFHFLI